MAIKVSGQISTVNSDQTGAGPSRTYGNLNNKYIDSAPYGTSPALPYYDYYEYPDDDEEESVRRYATSYADWALWCGRALMRLSQNQFLDIAISGTFSATEEAANKE